ncbi:MAG: uracil-DNA glycosylase, partial [Chloroflexota bacterium]
LHGTALQGVPGEGPSDAEVMMVGEGPGFNEDQQGRPFVGAAGKFLDQVLPLAGIRRDGVYITNVVKHRPPGNRDPEPAELAACLPYLQRQIEVVQPRIIVTLGRFSLATFLPGQLISRVHGQPRRLEDRFLYPMYHPAAALRQDRVKDIFREDMQRLGRFLHSPQYQTLSRQPEALERPPEQLGLL